MNKDDFEKWWNDISEKTVLIPEIKVAVESKEESDTITQQEIDEFLNDCNQSNLDNALFKNNN